MDSSKIKDFVTKMLEITSTHEMKMLYKLNKQSYYAKLDEKFAYYHEKYPTLFYMIADNPDTFDMQRLDYMLNMKQKIENKETTNEDMSKEIGQKYFDEFVSPIVDKLDKKN